MDLDAIIVGAGPAGAATAWHLAGRGRRVLLLDKEAFPRDKSCGDGLTRSAVALLAEMGVLDRLGSAQIVRGVRIVMRGKGSRVFDYPRKKDGVDYGLVFPRLQLDHVLCQMAVERGAELWEKTLVEQPILDQDRVIGVEAVHQDKRQQFCAKVVVAANGANSRLARQAGLITTPAHNYGFAIRGYFSQITDLEDLLEIYTPLLDPTDLYLLPSYGWVFPTSLSTANIGVGIFQREQGVNIRELYLRFLDRLRQEDPRFQNAVACGPPKGAPLRFDFSPENCAMDGLFMVGDAAGMISPFTGEGISYALESGKIAAQVIDRGLNGNKKLPDYREYSRILANRLVGSFEAGRHAARRYIFIWHVLDATFHNERPLFALCRQRAFFPEDVSDPMPYGLLEDVSHCIPQDSFRLRADLVSIGEALNDAVRQEWPFLVKFAVPNADCAVIPFRPALLLLLAAYNGNPNNVQLTLVGAAVELGYLAALAKLSVIEDLAEDAPQDRRPVNWSNLFAVTVADFLLSRGYHLGAKAGVGVSTIIAESLSRFCEGRVRELRHVFDMDLTLDEHLDIISQKTGALFELPCHLGAYLGGAVKGCESLSAYGRLLGLSYQLTEDVIELEGRPRSFGPSTSTDLLDGIYSIPVRLALKKQGKMQEQLRSLLARQELSAESVSQVHSIVKESGVIPEVLTMARELAQRAQQLLAPMPPAPSLTALWHLAEYAATRKRTNIGL